MFSISDDYVILSIFRLPCPSTSTHKVVTVHIGDPVDSDSLEVVDFDAHRIAGVVKRSVVSCGFVVNGIIREDFIRHLLSFRSLFELSG